MSKLHYCLNGRSVTEQVIQYQNSRSPEDYLLIQLYYDNYKDYWYRQLADYIDRATFESDFDFKLSCAVESFREKIASGIAEEKGYGSLGAFNGLFYKILSNWRSNIKTQAFRLKKRPSVQCPVCGRYVGRIDRVHLMHYKTLKDLPKYFVFKRQIYETCFIPRIYVVTWGKYSRTKIKELFDGNFKSFISEKRRKRWLWKLSNNEKGVFCPLTKKVVPEINEEYIRSLPDKLSRYAEPMTWEQFIETYPYARIQSEMFNLHYALDEDEKMELKDCIYKDFRKEEKTKEMPYKDILEGKFSVEYEFVFKMIDKNISDSIDKIILKLIAADYGLEDIAKKLEIKRKEVKNRISTIKNNKEFEKLLVEGSII